MLYRAFVCRKERVCGIFLWFVHRLNVGAPTHIAIIILCCSNGGGIGLELQKMCTCCATFNTAYARQTSAAATLLYSIIAWHLYTRTQTNNTSMMDNYAHVDENDDDDFRAHMLSGQLFLTGKSTMPIACYEYHVLNSICLWCECNWALRAERFVLLCSCVVVAADFCLYANYAMDVHNYCILDACIWSDRNYEAVLAWKCCSY